MLDRVRVLLRRSPGAPTAKAGGRSGRMGGAANRWDGPDAGGDDEQLTHDLLADVLPRPESAPESQEASPGLERDAAPTSPPGSDGRRDFGQAGRPLNRQSPFFVGFVGALGVLAAYGLWQAVASLDTVLTLIVISFFLTLALNPLVEFLVRRRLARGLAVTVVFLLLVLVFVLLGSLVLPPVSQQATDLVNSTPRYFEEILRNPQVQELDRHYEVIARIQEELNRRITDNAFMSQVAGGILGAGRLIASGVFSTLTVLVLTLYFLVSLPALKQAAYALVPASRRPRVISLSEEMMRRVGSYAIGQIAVAAVNAFCAWIMMSIVGIRYAAVLAVAVGLLGLIPMVGASLGAVIVGVVALFDDPTKAVIAITYFVIYQQIENYLVAPRIMQRTVSVPGTVTIVAALVGGTLLGVVGALIAIPTAAGLLLLYEEVLVPRQRRH